MVHKSKFGYGFLSPPLERGSNKRPGGCFQPPVTSLMLETYHFAHGSGQHVVDRREMGRGWYCLFQGIIGHEEHRGCLCKKACESLTQEERQGTHHQEHYRR